MYFKLLGVVILILCRTKDNELGKACFSDLISHFVQLSFLQCCSPYPFLARNHIAELSPCLHCCELGFPGSNPREVSMLSMY